MKYMESALTNARETELKCRRMILTMAALLADEGHYQQLTAAGFQRALGRAGLISDRAFVQSVIDEYRVAGLLDLLATDDNNPRYRITAKGETQLVIMGEGIEHTLRWIHECTEETLRKHSATARQAEPPIEVSVCNAQEAPLGLVEDHAMVCLTGPELNAWWDSLTLDGKAEVMMNHYASLTAEKQQKGTAHA